MNFDDVLPYLSRGNFGSYQKKIYFLLCLPPIICAFHKLAGVFLLAVPDHRCRSPSDPIENFSVGDDQNSSIFSYGNSEDEFLKCHLSRHGINDTSKVFKCTEFIWSTEKIQSSAAKTFSLVCDRSTLRASADSMMMLGMLIGSYIFGDLSDKLGRRPTLMLSLLVQVVFGLLTAISSGFVTYTIARMFVGSSISGVFNVAYCLALELVGNESRVAAGVIIQFFYSLGFVLSAGIAFIFRENWRWFQIAISLPGLFFLSYWWIVPESPRWLLSHGHKDKAIKIFKKVAKTNKIEIPEEVFEQLEAEKVDKSLPKPSIVDLFRTPNLRSKSLLMFFNWFVISAAYFGLSWSTNDLGGNEFLNFVLCGLVEFPAIYFLLITLDQLGRRKILVVSMFLAGSTLLIALTIPASQNRLFIVLAMTAKMFITVAYSVVYIFSAELFPTVVRNLALGLASMSATIGSMIAPYLIFLSQLWKPSLFLALGIASLFAGFSAIFLPETLNKELPETLADGERLGKSSKKVVFVEIELEDSKEIE